jgi:hypothetical protein
MKVSTRHLLLQKVIGEWGVRKWITTDAQTVPETYKCTYQNESLRLALLEQLGG